MSHQSLTELTDQELVQKLKKLRTSKLIDAVLVGITIGIVIYAAINHGFGFFTFFPLLLTYSIVRNASNARLLEKEMEKELASRQSGSEM